MCNVKNMSWFRDLFGREPGETVAGGPALDIGPGETVVVEFLESHPRIVDTSMGRRAVINVKVEDELYSLWLSRIGLASAIALLEEERGDLKGIKARITNEGKRGRQYIYRLEVVKEAEKP